MTRNVSLFKGTLQWPVKSQRRQRRGAGAARSIPSPVNNLQKSQSPSYLGCWTLLGFWRWPSRIKSQVAAMGRQAIPFSLAASDRRAATKLATLSQNIPPSGSDEDFLLPVTDLSVAL